ncbi:venom acid phosphatase Acph-1-like, partial [Sitophilus oryzae]|uniref:acid phosphatase n=1 Tax=Sitophilus oryzae TaxID=7048 RepID=A0A6J2XV61_SITOR
MNYIDARTTDSNRTKMSLELMLAALWPPTMEEKFYPCLKWQPIPYNYIRSDKELDGTKTCKIYNSLYQSVFNSTETQNALAEFNPVFEYVSNATGQEFSTPEDIFSLYMELFAQKNYGYALENWTDPVFPDVLERIAVTQYYIESNTTDLRKLGAGYLLKKIINDSKAKIDGLLKPQSRKMFVYSAHERNLAYVLIALGVFNDKVPPYGCHILFEVHLIDNVYGFKIYYQDWENRDPKLMTIPGCTEFCPYDKFVEIFKDI